MKKGLIVMFLVLVGCVSNKPLMESEASFGTVIGRVLLMNGEPVRSQTVNLIERIERNENDPFYPYIKMKYEISDTTMTDRNGSFVFEHVKSGSYSVTAEEIQSGMFQVPVGSSMHVEDGRVTDFGDISVMVE